MNKPYCTIMIPTYNQSQYLKQAVDSALAQEDVSLEVVVGVDGSDSESIELLEQYHDPRLRWHRNLPRLGRVANYHDLLVNHARGEWVLNLDGDDFLIDPRFLAEALESAREDPETVLVFADRYEMDDPLRSVPEASASLGYNVNRFSGFEYILSWPRRDARIHHLTAAYRRDKAIETGFYTEDIISSDYDSLFRLMTHGNVIYLDKKVAVWRIHGLNASRNKTIRQKADDFRWLENVYHYAIDVCPERTKEMRRWFKKNVFHKLYNVTLDAWRNNDKESADQITKLLSERWQWLWFSLRLPLVYRLKLIYRLNSLHRS